MSEIKGQLLGIVLVVAVFGAVGGMLLYAFQASAKNVATSVSEIDGKEITPVDPSKAAVDDSIISNSDLLTF